MYGLILENTFHVLLHVFERRGCNFLSIFPSFSLSLSFSISLTTLSTVVFLLLVSFCFYKLLRNIGGLCKILSIKVLVTIRLCHLSHLSVVDHVSNGSRTVFNYFMTPKLFFF